MIRQGQTSRNKEMNRVEWSDSTSSTARKDYIVPMVAGFYVTFKGIFGADSRLALVYTAFSYMGNLVKMINFSVAQESFCFVKFITAEWRIASTNFNTFSPCNIPIFFKSHGKKFFFYLFFKCYISKCQYH